MGGGSKIDIAIARLHSRTRATAECKHASMVLNIHLTFPPGYILADRERVSRR